jgi:single-strand DNA-binding protein
MLNQVTLVGRLVRKPEVIESENKTKRSSITLAVPRNFKNVNGEYETDFIDCILWQNNALNTAEYCDKGDIIGIRGRIQTSVYEKEGTKIYKKEIIAEKVTFLSSNKKEKAE